MDSVNRGVEATTIGEEVETSMTSAEAGVPCYDLAKGVAAMALGEKDETPLNSSDAELPLQAAAAEAEATCQGAASNDTEIVEVNVVLHFSREHFPFGKVKPFSIFVARNTSVRDMKKNYFDSYLKPLIDEHEGWGLTWQDFHLLFNLKPMEHNLALAHYIDNYMPELSRVRVHALLGTRSFDFRISGQESFNVKETFEDGTTFSYYLKTEERDEPTIVTVLSEEEWDSDAELYLRTDPDEAWEGINRHRYKKFDMRNQN